MSPSVDVVNMSNFSDLRAKLEAQEIEVNLLFLLSFKFVFNYLVTGSAAYFFAC